jgi:hypothetical protein
MKPALKLVEYQPKASFKKTQNIKKTETVEQRPEAQPAPELNTDLHVLPIPWDQIVEMGQLEKAPRSNIGRVYE